MTRLLIAALPVSTTFLAAGTTSTQAKFEFKLGFKALADNVPSVVGQPIEVELWGANGDSLQKTTTGLMVWRKADNSTAFTNGSHTWINGPNGVQDRQNDMRFEWEVAAQVPGVAPTPVAANPQPATTPQPTAASRPAPTAQPSPIR